MNSDGLFESSLVVENLNGFGSPDGELVFVRSSSDIIDDGTEITTTFDASNEINHLQFPVLLNYNLVNRKFLVKLRAGLTWNYILNHKAELNGVAMDHTSLNFNRGAISPLDGIKRHSFSYLLGLGLEYRLTKYWSIILEPTYQNGLTSHIDFNDTKMFLTKSGINVGIKYNL